MTPEKEAWKATLGRRVRGLREARGLIRQALADRAGLSLRFLADVEAGRANPSLGSLYELADALGVEIVDLLRADAASTPTRCIALLGLRGAGKSAIGRRAAALLGWPFIELDERIEREAGMSLAALFALHGEQHYRTLEHRVLAELVERSGPGTTPAVLATGGGVVTHEESFRLLRTHTLTAWLKATPDAHWDRVVAQGDARPMAKRARARAELDALYAARAPLYAQAALIVDTDALGVEGSAARIADAATASGTTARRAADG